MTACVTLRSVKLKWPAKFNFGGKGNCNNVPVDWSSLKCHAQSLLSGSLSGFAEAETLTLQNILWHSISERRTPQRVPLWPSSATALMLSCHSDYFIISGYRQKWEWLDSTEQKHSQIPSQCVLTSTQVHMPKTFLWLIYLKGNCFMFLNCLH